MTIDDPLLDEEGYAVIWVQSTPISCLDYLECGATDGDGTGNGTVGRLITDVTGKLISELPKGNSFGYMDPALPRVLQ